MGAEDDANSSHSDTQSTDTDLATPISCICCRRPSCRRLWHTFNNYWTFTTMYIVMLSYILIGGGIFNAVERPNELRTIESAQTARNAAINAFAGMLANLTNLTEQEALNVTDMLLELGTVLAEAEESIAVHDAPIWDFASSVFFASTVVTTIGYGTIAPVTAAGQILFIFYAIVGIPLALIFLTRIGKILEVWVDRTLRPVQRRWGSTVSRLTASALLATVGVFFFVLIPAGIFTHFETWSYRESLYYTMVTLTTVGFGDFVPGIFRSSVTGPLNGLYKIITVVWLWMGLAVVAALISEVQDLILALEKMYENKCKRCCRKVDTDKVELENVGSGGKASPPTTPTNTNTA